MVLGTEVQDDVVVFACLLVGCGCKREVPAKEKIEKEGRARKHGDLKEMHAISQERPNPSWRPG